MKLWVPAERLAAIIDTAGVRPHPESNLARKLYDLRHGRQGYISLAAADRLLTELDLHYLLYIPKDKGGLADIYEDGIQYGRPNHLSKKNLSKPKPWKRKYYTEEERLAARRETYRRYYQRKKLRRAA